ncbi:MAG: RNA polymerase sigma factor [Rhodospirillales bacterium]|nr:RNA polymerase sigma factor [Rhodospirillales bacterium]
MAAVEADQIAAHRETVRGVLLRLVRDSALADDLVQETMLRATRAVASMRGDAALATWLTAIALNVARDHFRVTKRTPQTAPLEQAEQMPDAGDTEGEVMQAEMSICILGHVARLPERQREAVLLHHFGSLGHREIASTLGISEGNARIILHRGLAALRASLGRECSLNFNDDIPCERL